MGKQKQTWKTKFKIKDGLSTGDLLALESVLMENAKFYLPGSTTHHALYLQAAIGAGWVESPKATVHEITVVDGKNTKKQWRIGDVPVVDLPPYQTDYYGDLVVSAFDKAKNVPLVNCWRPLI